VTQADTIVALASAPGRGAVAMIRVSGTDVPRIAGAMLGGLPPPRTAHLASFLGPDGIALDQGLALYFPAPASYTGEHVLELQGHGGVVVVDALLKRLLALGCRMARPGEFSERAFLNGKLDIVQAEAIADLIDAGTAAAARAAVRSLQGEFSSHIHALQSLITGLRSYVEAAIDFPDEEIDFLKDAALHQRLAEVFAAFDAVHAAARQGTLLREGMNVAIAGKPNAGKSSLMNRLAGADIAIVADVPGTTRDVLRQHLHLNGMPLNLVDTAGLRSATDAVEAEGVRRARAEIARADHVLYVLDVGLAADRDAAQWRRELAELPSGIPVTLIFNKIDANGVAPGVDTREMPAQIFLSARTGEGMDLLRAHLQRSAGYLDSESGALSARRRHLDALARARRHVAEAADTLNTTRAFELFAEDLRLAQRSLAEITGEFTSEDLLGEIFGSFCIGK
jgi:tRNA modification GTPase